jgi:hypothetical protein
MVGSAARRLVSPQAAAGGFEFPENGATAAAGPPLYESDAFRIAAYKILLCSNRGQHDW